MTAAKSKTAAKRPKAAAKAAKPPVAKKGCILTGHRPTGPRHIGHLVGTLEQWARMQDDYDCYFLIADLHVLTTDYEHPARIQQNIRDVMIDWLAAGVDPKRPTFFAPPAPGGKAEPGAL